MSAQTELEALEDEQVELEGVLWSESATTRERDRAEDRLEVVRKRIDELEQGT